MRDDRGRGRIRSGRGYACRLWYVLTCLASLPVLGGDAASKPLADLDAHFEGREVPVYMEYDAGYRFLNIEMSRVAKVHNMTRIGQWRDQVTGRQVPAIFLDMRVDSPDEGKEGHRCRISIHDRLVAVLALPDLHALVFAKYTDEYLKPFLRASQVRGVSVYDTQSGHMEFHHQNLMTGILYTNLHNGEALLDLSRRIGPIMGFLVEQYKHPGVQAPSEDNSRVVANLDGKVAALKILTERTRSPAFLCRQRQETLFIRTVAERGSAIRPRNFRAWGMPFGALAELMKDDALIQSARTAPVETIVPVVMDYELALGMVRVTLRSVRAGAVPGSSGGTEGPEPVAQEQSKTNETFGTELRQGGHQIGSEPHEMVDGVAE